MKIFSYFCPFSKEFNSCKDFARLSGGQKALTILATIGATLISLPFLGFGGFATFRAMVEKYSFKKIDPKGGSDKGSGDNDDGESVARDVHRVVHPEGGSFVGTRSVEGGSTPEKVEEKPKEEEENKVRRPSRFVSPDDGYVGLHSEATRRLLYPIEVAIIDREPEKKEVAPVVEVERRTVEEIEPAEEVRGSEGKEEEAKPKEVHIHLDALTAEERGDIANKITIELEKRKGRGDQEYLQEAHERFMGDVRQVVPKAMKLYRDFRRKFIRAEKLPVVDQETGMIYSTLYQLKTAIEMAQNQFPGLTSLIYNEEQRIAVARLIQIIMCGESVFDLPMPESSSCFQLLELQGRHTPSVAVPVGELDENTPALDFILYNILKKREDKSESEHLEANIREAASLFVNDSINRTLNTFRFGDIEIPLGLRGEKNKDDPAAFVKVMNEAYTKYLLANPDKIQEIIRANKNSKYLRKLCEQFSGDEEIEKSGLPEAVLQKLLDPEIKANNHNPRIVSALMNLSLNSRIEKKTLEEIVEKSGCDPKDVEPLVRIKLLELMVLMNQAYLADGCGQLHDVTDQYGLKVGRMGLHPSTTSSDFVIPVSEESRSSNFNDFQSRTKYSLEVVDSSEEGIKQCVPGRLTIAEVFVNDQLDKFTSPGGRRSIIAMEGLRLSWLTPKGIMDFLAKQIDPEVIQQQPDVKYPRMKEKMLEAKETLERIAIDVTDLEGVDQTIDEITATCREYLRIVSQIDVDEKEVTGIVDVLRPSLAHAAVELEKLPGSKLILEKINGLLSEMPESKVEGPSYFDRLRGVFVESSDPKEVMWRVKKYESQILELRKAFERKFSDVLEERLDESLDGSWMKVPNKKPQDIIKELYDELLNSVSIELADEERFNQEHLAKVRRTYNDRFLSRLRQALGDEGENPYVQDICEVLFTQLNFGTQSQETIDSFNEMGARVLGQKVDDIDPDGPGRHEFVQRLHTLYRRVACVPYSAKQPLLEQLHNSA
ncbi:MAG: hypothetical protein K940chlam7_00590, partial [Chlamydiae bacterium]|nr:hypothetical protein [Chlamydiota bacterium]